MEYVQKKKKQNEKVVKIVYLGGRDNPLLRTKARVITHVNSNALRLQLVKTLGRSQTPQIRVVHKP